MNLFSNCSGECILCNCHGCCLAGHGDDDFYPATDEQLLQRLDELNNKPYPDNRKDIILDELKRRGVYIAVGTDNFDNDNPKLAVNSNSLINTVNDNDGPNCISLCNVNDGDGKLFNADGSTLKIELDNISNKSCLDLTKHFSRAEAILDKLSDNTKHISDKPKIVTSYGLDLSDYTGTKECIELFKSNPSVVVVGPDGSKYQCGKKVED